MKLLLQILFLSLLSLKVQAIEATHGMVIFGEEKILAYHLPMFHKVHAYQVVLELKLNDTLKTELSALQQKGELVTFVPTPFDMDKFLANPHSLKGDFYLGHFEKDGQLIHENISVDVVKTIYQKPIRIETATRALDDYILVGSSKDLYAIHLLNGVYHQDHIVKLKAMTSLWNVRYLNEAISNNKTLKFSKSIIEQGDVFKFEFLFQGHCRLEECPRTVMISGEVEKIIFNDHVH